MPRVMTAAVDSAETDGLLERLGALDGVLSLQVHRGASVKEPGDVLVVMATDRGAPRVLEVLGRDEAVRPTSLTVTEPDAAYSKSGQALIDRDITESTWEETDLYLHRTSWLSVNFLMLMACGGGLAAAGLSMGVLPLVLGAAVIVPAFSPLAYLGWGIGLRNPRILRKALLSTFLGFAVLAAAAALVFILLRASGEGSIEKFLAFPLTYHWTSFGVSTVIITALAAAAGAIIILSHRSVLTAGVLIALSLVPAAAIIGIGLAAGLWEYALRGLGMWALNAGLIVLVAAVVVALKKKGFHRRAIWY